MASTGLRIELQVAENVYLRNATPDDAQALFKIIDSQREYLREWLSFVDLTREVDHTSLYLQSILNSRTDKVFVIVVDDQVAGLIGYKGTEQYNAKTEIGYWLSEKCQGKGVMQQCCRRLINYAFRDMRLNRVQLKIAPGNYKSLNIAHKLGFTLEGTEREGEFLNGRFQDLEVYSLLKSEWDDAKPFI